jgi:superfamily II DNA or RNA helicase
MVCNETLFKKYDNLNYQVVYRLAVEENMVRNFLVCRIASEKMDEGKPVLVIVHTVRHAQQLMGKFSDRNLERVRLITGAVDGQDRQDLIKDLNSGKILGIVATPVFDEGADIPNLRVLVLGGGGKSPIKVIQRMGRGMRRKAEGSNTVEIFDFLDVTNKYTRRHAQQRMKVYSGEGFEVGKIVI